MAVQVTDGRDSFQMWRVAVNISNKISSSPQHKFNVVRPAICDTRFVLLLLVTLKSVYY